MMHCHYLTGLFIAASFAALPVLGKTVGMKTPPTGYSFEESTVPAEWQGRGLDLSISDRHFKDGTRSLAWHWHAGQKLIVNRPHGLKETSQFADGGVCVWIYNETPTQGALTFRFGSNEELNAGRPAPYQFQFGLNFKGWRAAWVQFVEDATNPAYRGAKNPPLEAMQLIAPDGANTTQGTLFFDQLNFQEVGWLRTPDYQLPFINPTRGGPNVSDDMKDQHIDINGYQWSQLKPPAAPATITPEQKQAFKTIANRYDHWLYGKDLDPQSEPYYQIRFQALSKYIVDGKAAFAKLNIRRNGDQITGTPLFALMDTANTPSFTDVFENVFVPLALDWKLNHNQQSKQNFFDLLDYVHDQGWDEGSSNGTLDHSPLRVAGYMHAVYIMRDELKAAGRLNHELATMRWYTYFNQAYWAQLPPGNSADEIRNAMLHKLLMVLAMDDSPEKVRDMRALVFWENQALAIAPGFVDCIKPDFVGFHHRGIYGNVYAPDAFEMAALCFYLQHGTAFSMSDQSADNLRNALLTQRIITNKYVAPIAISGRMPFGTGTTNKISPGYAYMALSSDTPDKRMAAAFMRLWDPSSSFYQKEVFAQARAGIFFGNTMGSLQLMKQVVDMGVKPEAEPGGNWIKPYGGLMIHRRDDWMLCVKGWSKYVWSFERSPRENVFGRDLSFGSIQILGSGSPVTQEASGYVEAGWDWNRWPGTTAINVPLDELNDKSNRMRTFSDQTFVGGVSLDGRNGLFAMRLHDTVYHPSFYANKSVFCFDNRVICLGSGIVNDDTQRQTETTLFQNHLPDSTTPTWINSIAPVSSLDVAQKFDDGKPVWLMDAVGNGYVIPNAQGVRVARQQQQSIDNSGKETTKGDFAVAWIDHGRAPRDAGYEYAILIQARSPAEVAQLALAPGYEVLRRDDAAHAVRDTQSGAVGYAIFNADLPVDIDLLQSVSLPCMALIHREHDQLTLSLANPDLGLIPPNEPAPEDIEDGITNRNLLRRASPQSVVRVTLAGLWEATDQKMARIVRTDENNTVIEVTCQNGLTTQVTLHRK